MMSIMFLRLFVTSMTLIITTSSSLLVDETVTDVLQQVDEGNSITTMESTTSSMSSSMMNASMDGDLIYEDYIAFSKGKLNHSSSSSHRDLQIFQLFGRSILCKSTDTNIWETISVLRLFRNFHLRRGAEPGSCIDACPLVCDHEACINDFEVNEDDSTCECDPTPKTRCGGNTFCDTPNDQCLCNKGYRGVAESTLGCIDINECAENTTICGPNSICSNIPGSYTCACRVGYSGTPPNNPCTDINECQSNICNVINGPVAECANSDGFYNCTCPSGYSWSKAYGTGCTDINECNDNICGANSACVNSPGSYNCTCFSGFNGTPPVSQCTDLNECANTPDICGPNATCSNGAGNFSCACNRGYIGTPPNCGPDSCTAINVTCGDNSVCNTTTTPASCSCLRGYTGNATIGCVDINECSPSTPCSSTSTCVNTPGSFKCLTNEFQSCSKGLDDTCLDKNCAQTSRSDPNYVCCPIVGPCGNEKCCNGAYIAGEVCPSNNDLDCAVGLSCARSSTFDGTKICCQNPFTLLGSKQCSL